LRIDVDLVLLYVSTDGRDFGDPRNGIQLVADEPVLQGAKLTQGMVRAFERVPEDMADARRVWTKRGHGRIGQQPGDQIEAFEDS
jgi:hypothetical protein